MLPKSIYRQAYRDITKAYFEGVFVTKEWVNRIKAIYALFENDYPNKFLMEEQEWHKQQ